VNRDPEDIRAAIAKRVQPGTGDCIIWTGAIDSDGYPKINIGKTEAGWPRFAPVHRIHWELINGPILDGLHLNRTADCPNRRCIATYHMELLVKGTAGGRVTSKTRVLGLTYPCGHDRVEGYRQCRPCNREASRRWRERHPDKVRAYYQSRKLAA
jgi:hypothetical protein